VVALTITPAVAAATTTTAFLAIGALARVCCAFGIRCAGATCGLAFRTRTTLPTFRARATATATLVGVWTTVLTRTALAFLAWCLCLRRRVRRAGIDCAGRRFRAACLGGGSVFATRTVAARTATTTTIAAAAAATTITTATRATRATTATRTAAATAGVFTFRSAARGNDGDD
jgi:hypothetical protein